jgi:penicillin amidase
MITDNTSSTSESIVNAMIATLDVSKFSTNEKQALTVLKNWKGTNNLQDIAPTLYNKWLYFYLKNTFEDEMGEEEFQLFLGTHIMKQVIEAQSQNETSPWWDNCATKNRKETRQEILTSSFKLAIASLEKQHGTDINTWKWEKVHVLEHQHPIGKVALFHKFFNVGVFPIAGTNEVINNLFFTFSDATQYTIKGGPSSRRVIDFSDIENSQSILPTGQSGNPMSKHYNDQAAMYVDGKFRKMKLNKAEIIRTSTKLVFKPK